jgi:enoyl-CoA hydratase/carnithine racemase
VSAQVLDGFHDIVVEVDDPVGLIRLNRPEKLNAFTYRTLAEIRSAIRRLTDDARVVGIVVTGEGRGFSAGLDSQTLVDVTASSQGNPDAVSRPADAQASRDADLPGIFSYFLQVPKPIVAAINGVAAGGGLILALMSDVRIASSAASFTTVFLKRGLIAEHGSSWLLPRMVGIGRALDLLWMSDRIDAAAAREYGLVERVVAPEELLPAAFDYVRRLAVTSAPAAIAETKRLVYAHLGTGYVEALVGANAAQDRFVAAPDALEGARALVEKRAPSFARLGGAQGKDTHPGAN